MIESDQIMRKLPAEDALNYAGILAHNIYNVLEKERPDVILASYDGIQSSVSLGVARLLGVPWVAMSFTVIPNGLVGFVNGLSPNKLISLPFKWNEKELHDLAQETMRQYISNSNKVTAYIAPFALIEYADRLAKRATKLLHRIVHHETANWDRYTRPKASVQIADVVRRLKNRILLPERIMCSEPPAGDYAFVPLMMSPESTIDVWSTYFRDQVDMIKKIAISLPIDLELVIKLHFSDPDSYSRNVLQKLSDLPRVSIAHPSCSSRPFLENATVMLTTGGTASLEGALLGKPIVLLTETPYSAFPRSIYVSNFDELYPSICAMIELPHPTDDEILRAFKTYLSKYMPGRNNDWARPVSTAEIERLGRCFEQLKNCLSDEVVVDNWHY